MRRNLGRHTDSDSVRPVDQQIRDSRGENVRLNFAAIVLLSEIFFFSSRRRHTRSLCDWSSDVCSSDLAALIAGTALLSAPSLTFAPAQAQTFAEAKQKAAKAAKKAPAPKDSRKDQQARPDRKSVV